MGGSVARGLESPPMIALLSLILIITAYFTQRKSRMVLIFSGRPHWPPPHATSSPLNADLLKDNRHLYMIVD